VSNSITWCRLASRDGKPLDWFEIIDADEGGFVKADAALMGQRGALATGLKHPVACALPGAPGGTHLMNVEGLPLVPSARETCPSATGSA